MTNTTLLIIAMALITAILALVADTLRQVKKNLKILNELKQAKMRDVEMREILKKLDAMPNSNQAERVTWKNAD